MSSFLLYGQSVQPAKPQAGFYVVATPIGNLKDITLRALEILAGVDVVLCEDSRVTLKLLQHYGIKARCMAYHDHNGEEMRPKIIKMLQEGLSLALVSDAGTPLIADPGFKLVRALREAQVPVWGIPGACALTTALSSAGFPTDTFLFDGFLPQKTQARETRIKALMGLSATLIFYEGASRLTDSLSSFMHLMPNRKLCVARELTKMFEEYRLGSPIDLHAHYEAYPPKGEMLILVHPAQEEGIDEASLTALIQDYLTRHSLKEASNLIAEQYNLPKRDVYQKALALKP
jgi:16S rRNA (cytidine1402-2'-O)-methyltransferase